MRYYQQCTTGTSLLCSIYVFILHTGRPTKSKTCLTKLECLLLASVREKEKKGHFLKNFYIHTKPPAAFGWTQHFHSTPTSSFFPLLNQPGIGALPNLQEFLLNFSFHYYYEIFLPSSSWWPYQYITVVFRNSLPSATEDTHISQELAKSQHAADAKKKKKKQHSGYDCRCNIKMLPCGLPASAALMWIQTKPEIRLLQDHDKSD